MKSEQRIPFDLGKGPLIKFVLVHSHEVSDLVIVCNHTICDGMSLAILVRDLLALYEDLAQQVTALDLPDVMEILKPGISIQGLITRFFVSLANRKGIKNPYFLGRRSMPLCTGGSGMTGNPVLEYFGFLEKVHGGGDGMNKISREKSGKDE